MRFVRSQTDQGDFKYFRLLQELLAIETTHNVKLLPESCKNHNTLTKFTTQEQYDYDKANCMHNKRKGKKIKEEMDGIDPKEYDPDTLQSKMFR